MDYTHPDFTPSVFAEDKENPLPRKEKSRSVKRKALHNSNSSNFPNERPAVHSKEKDLEVSTVPKDQFDDLNTVHSPSCRLAESSSVDDILCAVARNSVKYISANFAH
ncbi:hypothetical protein CAPTEDRAFT_200981 [Capitella teleta]|uniref:Uncharacterized protein n=1 Tax=Capitella teleta TaxID=283909 RepID=R7VFS9_CAPTE|nr:hypothetical protein CAPTEDRAFT_200981 [Capitella teleta]|eukprot:ELU15151.1 hypothetical protein CAPTEDRAFT_200981 [Capitella teleta]